MRHPSVLTTKKLNRLPVWIVLGGLLIVLYRPLLNVIGLILGGSIIAFLLLPLSKIFEKKLSRPLSALLSLLIVGLLLSGLIWLMLPMLFRELQVLAQRLPDSLSIAIGGLNQLANWISAHITGIALSENLFKGATGMIERFADSALSFFRNAANLTGQISLMVVLGYFFLCDRDGLLLRIELFIPKKHRAIAVRMGQAVLRELRMYLRGQMTVVLILSILSTLALLILNLPGALVLGPFMGLMNIIPYFGPFIGGVPAVLLALSVSFEKALICLGVVCLIQQIDNNFISPRIMGHLTGLSPALVLIAIFAGAQLCGVVGMLFALPVIMTFRTLFRVFVQRHENI